MTCRTPDCRRRTRSSSSGVLSCYCDQCTRRYLAEAFGERSWHAQARVGALRPAVSDGVPATPIDAPAPVAPPGGGNPARRWRPSLAVLAFRAPGSA